MKLLDQVKDLKGQGYTIDQIASTLNLPTWFIASIYNNV